MARSDIDASLLDPEAVKVVERLRQRGHQAYLVGGCVRDLLLGRRPKDFDVATSAHPSEVRSLFRNSRLIGRRFRLAQVYFKDRKVVEVSTFRAPSVIEETDPASDESGSRADDLLITEDNVFGTAEQDALRRDFTINGLFYDLGAKAVIDYVRGRQDLEQQLIRTIGDPEIRIREDPVRILRAVRFACRLRFEIEPRTYAAMEGAVEDLPRCSPPRLLEETFRLLRGGIAGPSLKLLRALGALKILLPPIDEYLVREGKSGEELFDSFASALDRHAAQEHLDDATLIAVLLVPVSRVHPPPEPHKGRAGINHEIDELLTGFVRTARLPKKIAERCRSILTAQSVLSGERRKRGSLSRFRRQPIFKDALIVFEMSVEATGENRAALEAWKSGGTPFGPPAGEPAPKRRRRRGSRRAADRPRAAKAAKAAD
jgi:poly(A) polymerase